MLQRLAEFREKAARLKRRIIGAMIYPIAVIFFAGLILTGIIIWIIPSFKEMFESMGVELPVPTKILLGMSDFAVDYWWAIPLVPIGIIVLYKLFRTTRTGKRSCDWVKFHFPLFGTIVRKGSIARFTRTFGTLISSGVPILEALNISRDTAGNFLLANAISQVHDSIREGERQSVSGVMRHIADDYDDQVDTAVEGLTALMEPIMVICLGLIIGFIVISLFLPLIALMGALS